MDLDDLLDDIDINALPAQEKSSSQKSIEKKVVATAPLSAKLSTAFALVSQDNKPWLAASANVPKDLREKWTKMTKIDSDISLSSPFDNSNAYRSWEAANSTAKVGVAKALQELIRKAAARCDLDETQIAKILNLANPLTDRENGTNLVDSFSRQFIKDLSTDILNDPNYDPSRFPSLSMLLLD